MRTTLTLDDTLAKALKERAVSTGRSFKNVVNETLRRGLHASSGAASGRPRTKQRTVSLGQPMAGVDLTKALALAGSLEDEETARKVELRK